MTILKQDQVGGLQVQLPQSSINGGEDKECWVAAPPIPGTFVVNLGEMLQIWTAGRYLATPHRVANSSSVGRLSMPFFFDPNFRSPVHPVKALCRSEKELMHYRSLAPRQYGDHITAKVAQCFPDLFSSSEEQEQAKKDHQVAKL